MSIAFSRSTASLRADAYHRSLWTLLLAAVLLGLWAAWFFLADVGVFESTPAGRLEVSHESHPLQASVSGRVVTSNLVLDRVVKRGELLVQIDTQSEQLQLKEALTKRTALEEQLEAVRKEIAVEEKVLQMARSAGLVALREVRARSKEQQVAARFTDDKARRLARLRARGQMAELDILKAQAQASKDRAALDTLKIAARYQRQRQRTQEGDRRAMLEKLRSSVTQTTGQIATVTATIKLLQHNIDRRTIRAPVSGRLGEITKLVPGTYLREGDYLATIVPQTGKLKAVAAFTPPAALGRIRASQPARIRLHGFPWTQYGTVKATVSRVASETRNGQVRVELELHPDPGSPIPLQHGLPAEVEVEVERVSPAVLVLRAAGKLLTSARVSPGPGASPSQQAGPAASGGGTSGGTGGTGAVKP
jgi:membrane fusion protein (multidrug efflux system)